MKTLIRGGTLVTEYESLRADLLLEGEKIAAIGPELSCPEARVIEAEGKLVFPGFIDGHTHMDLPVCATVTADDLAAGTAAALLGGTTTIVDFATQEKGETLEQGLDNWHRKAEGKASCDYGFHLAISQWDRQAEADLPRIFRRGVTSFKLYMTYANQVTDRELLEVLLALKPLGGIVGVHCENSGMIDVMQRQVKARGITGPEGHPLSRPDEAEAEAVNRLLALARVADVPVIVVHLSSKKGLEVIRQAREQGQQVYVETCPQYLHLTDRVFEGADEKEGRRYICSPPLRTGEDLAALWEALDEGEIDLISTDHCSFTDAQKAAGQGDFTAIPGGMPGVEDRVRIMYHSWVAEDGAEPSRLVRVLAAQPARLFGLYPRKGCLQVGSDGDLVLFDPNWEGTIRSDQCHNAAGYTPYEGWKIRGRVEEVFLRGHHVVSGGRLIAAGLGQYLPRSSCQL